MVRIDGNSSFSKLSAAEELIPASKTETEKAAENTLEKDSSQLGDNEPHMFLDGSTYLQFSIHKESSHIIVKIVDSQTKEVIKEIPPEKMLDILSSLSKSTGLFIDQKR